MTLYDWIWYSVAFLLTEFGRYLLFTTGWVLVLWAGHRWTSGRKVQQRKATRKDILREITASVVSVAMYTLMAIIALYLVIVGVLRWSNDNPSVVMFVLIQVATAIGHDTYFYWTHRLMHHRKLFRPVHLTHHLSKTPTVYSSYSFSPVEGLVQAGFVPLWMVFVPMNELSVAVFFIHQMARNVIGHSGYELAWSGFTRSRLTGWIATTTHHDLHHSEGNYNFGLWFTWWDRWMGTEHPHYHERFEAVVQRRKQAAEGRKRAVSALDA